MQDLRKRWQLIISLALPECHLIPERRQIKHWKLWPLPNGVVWTVNIQPENMKISCISKYVLKVGSIVTLFFCHNSQSHLLQEFHQFKKKPNGFGILQEFRYRLLQEFHQFEEKPDGFRILLLWQFTLFHFCQSEFCQRNTLPEFLSREQN